MTGVARPRRRFLSIPVLMALLVGCGGSADGSDVTSPRPATSDDTAELTGELRVFAASSLTDGFESLEQAFEARHPELDVLLNLAGSNRLTAQLLEGAEADVFASADEVQMEALLDAGLASSPVAFATNDLQIAVAPGNPTGIDGLSDLGRAELVVVLASDAVPVGSYAAQALSRAGVVVDPSSYELDARAVLSKVALGEADAGIVYRSDVMAHPDTVDGVEIPDVQNVTARYPIVALSDSEQPRAARAFVAFVRSDAGRQLLRDAGFAMVS